MRKTILILLCAVLALMPLAAQAGSARPGAVPFTEKATGRAVSVLSKGDEKFSYMTDLNGLLLMEDNDGYLRYVTEEGGAYALGGYVTQAKGVASGTNVNVNDPVSNLQSKLQALLNNLAASRSSAKGILSPDIPLKYDFVGDRAYGRAQVCTAAEDTYLDDVANYPPMQATCPLLVLKVQFKDIKCLFSDKDWHDRIFENGVTQYYRTVSNGKFTYVPAEETADMIDDGVVTVTLPFDCPHFDFPNRTNQLVQNDPRSGLYTGDDGYNYAIYNMGSIFAYAMLEAESSVDFAKYDRNGDGFISPTELAVLVVYSGYDASYENAYAMRGTPAVWGHSWKYNNMLSNDVQENYHYMTMKVDGKRVSKYTVIGELSNYVGEDGSNGEYDYFTGKGTPQQTQFGLAAHELGHDLGLPDLYPTFDTHPVQRVEGLSLMGTGNWGAKPGEQLCSSPTHLDPMSKIYLGYYTPQYIDADGKFELYATEPTSQYNILRINTNDPDIYYLIENRQYVGYDRGLSQFYGERTGGLVIWRVNQRVLNTHWLANTVNNEEDNYGLMPLFLNKVTNPDTEIFEPFWSIQEKQINITLQQLPLIQLSMLSLPGATMRMDVKGVAVPAAPSTGDSFQPALWIALGLAALAGAAAVCLIGRKKRAQAQK